MATHGLRLGVLLAGLASLCLGAGGAGADDAKDDPPLRDLSQEVTALQALYQLQLTKAQMTALKALAKDTADKPPAAPAAKENDKVRKAFLALRTALVKANDAEKIAQLAEALDKVQEAEKAADLQDDTEITEEAREKTPRAFKLLTAKQVAIYGGLLADEINDPVERLNECLAKARELDDKEWKQFRADVSDEIGRLLAGVDVDKAEEIGNKAIQLMIVARGLSAEEFKKEGPALDKKAHEIAARAGPTDVIRHVIEYHLAELLSNPRLAAALDARLK